MTDAGVAAGNVIEGALNKRMIKVYGDALKTAIENNKKFFQAVKDLDANLDKLRAQGMTEAQIGRIRKTKVNQLLRSQQVVQNIAGDYAMAGGRITKDINAAMAQVYKANRDYTRRIIGKNIQVNFAEYDNRQIEVILSDTEPPFSKIAYKHLGNDLAIRRKLQDQMMQAVMLGEDQRKILNRIRLITGQSIKQARRVAQTERTRIQSQARQMAVEEAEKMGIKMEREWSTNMDGKERDTHAAANGQIVQTGEPFTVGGYKLMYPGDTSMGAPASETINCRCVMIPRVKKK